jgi:putative ABC transport system permease protein
MTDWRQFVREHLPPLKLAPAREAEIVEELAQQFEQSYVAAIARGATESAARARAELQIPDWRKLAHEILRAESSPSQAAAHNIAARIPERIRLEASPQQIRKRRGGSMFVDFLQDLRYALRMLRKAPGFTAIAILTIALGIGANTAIFSVVNAVLLHKLPYKDPDRLVWITDFIPRQGNQVVLDADYFAMRAQNHSFDDMTAYQSGAEFTLTGAGDPVRISGAQVSASFFHTLGVAPRLGREFSRAEDVPNGPHAAILMDSLWRNRFSADPAIVGRTIDLDGTAYSVIGVMPRQFQFLASTHTDLIVPYRLPNAGLGNRTVFMVDVIARLRPRVTIPTAIADLNAVNERLAPTRPGGWAKMFAGVQARVVSLHDKLVGNVRTALIVLIGAVCFVLLIACANVANLQLARASSRESEMAIRGALGASRVRLARQLLTENCLIALLGGGAGLFLAYALIVAIRTLGPKDVPFLASSTLNPLALAFTLVLSVGTGVIFGLFPVISSLRVSLEQTLKEAAARTKGGIVARRSQKVLMVLETALALALFVGAGLLLRTFQRIISVPPGFSPQNVLTAKISLPPNAYRTDEQQRAFFDQLEPRLASLPGVEAAGMGVLLPLEGMYYAAGIAFPGETPQLSLIGKSTNLNYVSPGYFPALRIPLIAGRYLDEQDVANSTPVVVVNQTFVRRYLPDTNPIGQRFQFGRNAAVQIVGVVADVKQMGLAADIDPMSYVPAEQSPSELMTLVLRTSGNPLQLVSAVRAEVAAIDKNLPLYSIQTMDELISGEVASQRFNAWLLGMFAGLAVVLAAVGIYGVMAYGVTQRTREIGIRMALGAEPEKVRAMILRQGMSLSLAGIAIGLVASLALTRGMRNLLFGVRPTDPLTFALVSVILIAAAFTACWIPARRASKVDPLVALRYE